MLSPVKSVRAGLVWSSPVAVLLSHVDELVRVRVWGAVVMRSLHQDGWMDVEAQILFLSRVNPLYPFSDPPGVSLIKSWLSWVSSQSVDVPSTLLPFVSQLWSTPKGPWPLRKLTRRLVFYSTAGIQSRSLSLIFLPWLSLSLSQSPNDKIALWQLGQGCQFWLPPPSPLRLCPSPLSL